MFIPVFKQILGLHFQFPIYVTYVCMLQSLFISCVLAYLLPGCSDFFLFWHHNRISWLCSVMHNAMKTRKTWNLTKPISLNRNCISFQMSASMVKTLWMLPYKNTNDFFFFQSRLYTNLILSRNYLIGWTGKHRIWQHFKSLI